MVHTNAAVHLTLLALATGGNTWLAIYAYRRHDVPGARPFAALAGTCATWVGSYAVSLLVFDPELRLVMESVQWLGAGYAPVAFLLFALAYTGYDALVSWRSAGVLAAVPTVALLLFWTNPAEVIYATDSPEVVEIQGMALLGIDWNLGFYVMVFYLYALVVVGAALLLRLVVQSEYLYADQAAVLLLGVAAPVVGTVYDVLLPVAFGIEVTPYAFAITGGLFGYGLFRQRLMDIVPATRKIGRDAAFGQLEDGVVIVDTDRRIVYCNDAAAEVLSSSVAEAVGNDVGDLVEEDAIDFGPEHALAEIEQADRVHEVRTSPIEDRQGRGIGHTLVFHDVTARKRREERLAAQRDELERLDDLNGVLRGVNQALVSASSRAEVERAVVERLAGSALYRRACVADLATWTGDADRWLVAGDDDLPQIRDRVERPDLDRDVGITLHDGPPDDVDDRSWAVVPVAYGRTVFGAIGLDTDRSTIGEREQNVLAELGETVGHAINAVENRQLLSAETVVALELACTDDGSPLVGATEGGGRLSLAGLVPNRDGQPVAYLQVQRGDPTDVADRLDARTAGTVRLVGDASGHGPLEWQIGGETALGLLVEFGTNVADLSADDGTVRFSLELASNDALRSLLDHLDARFPDTTVIAKQAETRETGSGPPTVDAIPADLTNRQREALEAAYRAGYFDWPRASTAEEVAQSLDITTPTLTAHLRKAEATLLTELFGHESEAEAD